MGGRGWRRISWALALLSSVPACDDGANGGAGASDTGGNGDGGGESSGGGTGSPSDLSTWCQAQCSSEERCNPDNTPATCVQDCVADPPVSHLDRFVDAFLVAIETCMTNRACGVGNESCLADGYTAVDPNFESNEPFIGCMGRRDECSDEFNDDTCYDLVGYKASLLSQAQECLAGDCASVSDCIDGL